MKTNGYKWLLVFLLALAGCASTAANTVSNAQSASYEAHYKAITEYADVISQSDYYTLSIEMSELPDAQYRYYIFVDDPQTAMYDCVIMAVENHIAYADAAKMMPCIGIFEAQKYSLIPYQVNTEAGFVKGLVINGTCDSPSVNLKIIVEWKDANRKKTTREVFQFEVSLQGTDTVVVPVKETGQ